MEFYSAANVDAWERYWMRVFGTSNLLNRRMPSPIHDKSRWLYKIKSAVKMAKSNCDSGQTSLRSLAEKFLGHQRCVMSLQDQFNLLVQGKRFLPKHISVPTVKKLRERIHRETGLEMLASFVVRTPFPCLDTRRALKEYIGQKLMSLDGWPSAYGAYLGDICTAVPTQLRRVQPLFKSFQLKVTTDYFFNCYKCKTPPRRCAEITERTGVALVKGHILTTELDWITKWDQRLNPAVFQQCLKNMLVRPWPHVERLL